VLLDALVHVSDLSPLGAALEELWMARALNVVSLAPLAACTRLRKLDLRDCSDLLLRAVQGLQLTCIHLADPQSVKIEGLVHDLLPNMRPHIQSHAAWTLIDLAANSGQQAAITAAGAIPALEQLQESSPKADVRQLAALALESLPH
jgi:hypothetical protein